MWYREYTDILSHFLTLAGENVFLQCVVKRARSNNQAKDGEKVILTKNQSELCCMIIIKISIGEKISGEYFHERFVS